MATSIIVISLILFFAIIVLATFILYSKNKFKKHESQIEEIIQKKNNPSNQELDNKIKELKTDVYKHLKENSDLIKSSFETIQNGIDYIRVNYKDETDTQNELMKNLTRDYHSVTNKINAVNNSVIEIKTMIGMFKDTEELNALKASIRSSTKKGTNKH